MPKLSRLAIKRLAGCLGGACLAVGVGCALLHYPFGQGLVQLSYDLPFVTRAPLVPPDLVLIYIDTASRAKFQLPSGLLDRRRHVELLQRLTRARARMVFYDIVFRDELPDVDPAFAAAIREHGNVVLGYYDSVSAHETQHGPRGFIQEAVRPNRLLREAAQHSGLLMVAFPDAKLAVRRLFTGDSEQEAAVWTAARALDKSHVLSNRLEERWLNFYAPSPAFPSVSFAAALDADGVPPGFFRDKIVFIGSHPDDLVSMKEREKFATPWTRFGHSFAPGAELLATSLANLTQANWLRRVPTGVQFALVLGFGFLLGAGPSLLRPWTAAAAVLGGSVLIAASAIYLQYGKNLWWSWIIPVAAQAPLGLIWSIGYQYAVASRREAEMQKAFSSYLSPHLVKRIAASEFELSLGGKEVEATILFSDLEGFTAMAESLTPEEVSKLLTGYFERITTHILQEEGTIIKYVGDSVMAVWGAPLPDQRQAERAVLAARGIIAASQGALAGPRLRTRLGINTGKALAGNLGSPFRFDYTVIGSTTNLANRLEALNQVLGTDVLISGATRRQLPATTPTRYLGQFLLRGTTQATEVYEAPATIQPFMATFLQGVRACEGGDLAGARVLFEQIANEDGPTRFYLEYLKALQTVPSPFILKVP